ncbi:MAG TPA: hypothetical protein VK956_07545, partial [Verrucomicrobium sp.]|nr:hypothetical protein [Verrucomicrobium sp.]
MSLRLVRILLLVLIALEGALLVFGPQIKDHLPAIEAALAADKKPDWEDDASLGIRYAAWINLGLLLALLATSKWWARPFSKPKSKYSEPGKRSALTDGDTPKSDLVEVSLWRPEGWFWPLVILAIA